jgi:cell shape-determining protein MreC
VLNCGLSQGVAAGQAIISQGYLAGKIIYATDQSSTAILATNSDFSADAEISQTTQTGIVSGSFNSGMVLDQVPQGNGLEKDSLVVTAGINPQIPKNILIGQVGDLMSASSSLFQKATLLSPLDFSNLGFVFVVKQ